MSSDTLVLNVLSVTTATPSTRLVRLDLDAQAFSYGAGQAALIGPAERDERVPYSIASAPAESAAHRWLDFLIKVEPTGRWGHVFDAIEEGQQIGVRGPFGSFLLPPHATEDRLLFIAGGTGIAPIRAMIVQALAAGQTTPMRLLYSAKTADDFAYLSELTELERAGRLEVTLRVTRDTPGTGGGRVGPAQLMPLIDDPATLCFVCGPESMVADVPKMLIDLGIDRRRVRVEEW